MDLLRKISSTTLIEALIATVLIVVIFIVSSLTINNLLLNNFNSNISEVESRLLQLEYNYQHHKFNLPYNETFKNWEINIIKDPAENNPIVIKYQAERISSGKIICKKRIYEP